MTVDNIQGDFIVGGDRTPGSQSELSSGNFVADNGLQSLGDAAPLQFSLPTIQSEFQSGSPDFNLPGFSDLDFHGPVMQHNIGADVVFVDPGVHDLAALLAGIKPGMDVVMLDPHRDALDQIAETLNGQHNISSVNIIAEGSSGQVDFSSGVLSLDDLTNGSNAADLATIGDALGKQGDLLLWSCNTGAGAHGQEFVNALAQLTGANVAASTGFIGASSLDGSWTLATESAPIHVTAPLTTEGIQHYDSDLGVTFSLIYPTYTKPPAGAGNYATGGHQVGFSYGTPGDNVLDNIYPGYSSTTGETKDSLNSSNAGNFTAFGSDVVFVATDPTHGRQLWITDGTVAGTQLLDVVNPSGDAFSGLDNGTVPMQVVGSDLFFAANDGTHGVELWVTDGTTGGTHLVKDINVGSGTSDPTSFVDFNGELFFAANTTGFGSPSTSNDQIWSSDGTSGSTVQITSLTHAGGAAYASSISNLQVVGSHLVFEFYNGTSADTATQLYVTDGTGPGTQLLDPSVTAESISSLTSLNGELYFDMNDGTHSNQLWMSDGTAGGTKMVTDIAGSGGDGFAATEFVVAGNGEVYFAGNDGTHGYQLWETNGTTGGTQMVDLVNPTGNAIYSGNMVTIGNEVYFGATDGPEDAEDIKLWESDGTSGGTQQVDPSVTATQITDLTNVNGTLYFVGVGSDNTWDIFKLSGTSIVEVASNFSTAEASDSDTPGGGIATFAFIGGGDTPPTVSSLTGSGTSGADFASGYTVTLTLTTSKDVTAAGGTTLLLSDGGTASYTSGSGTTTLTFTYDATDTPTSLTVSGISAGSLTDSLGTALSIAGTAVTDYSIAVSDTAAHVSANFNSLNSAVAEISSIALTDGGTPNLDLTAFQALNDTTLIGKISSAYDLVVKDSAADVAANFTALDGDVSNISAITFTDSGTPNLQLTAAQALDDTTLLGKITGSFNLVVNDSSTNVASNIDSLESDAASISSIILNDGGTPTLTVTATQESNDSTIIHKIAGPYDLHVTGVTGQSYSSYTAYVNASNVLTETVLFNNDSSQTIVGFVSGLTLAGTASVNTFDLQSAPDVTVNGSGSTDYYYFGAALTVSDTINGGTSAANDVILSGNYTGGNALTLGATTFSSVQEIIFDAGNSYNITANAATVGSGNTMTIFASGLGTSDSLTFNGSAVTNGNFVFDLGTGMSTITTGQGNDTVNGTSGTASITCGSGTDTIVFTSTFKAADSITGGDGTDTLSLSGIYTGGNALTFGATTISGISDILLKGGSYNITTNAANDTAGQSLTINAALLTASDTLTFNGSANAGSFDIHLGAGTSTITGGTGADLFFAAGTDTFAYVNANDITSGTVYDTITGMDFSTDHFRLNFAVSAVQTAITTADLSSSNFQAGLTHDLTTLGAHDAVLFTANHGSLAGQTFLIINDTGTVGYHTGDDLVIHIENSTGTLTAATFLMGT